MSDTLRQERRGFQPDDGCWQTNSNQSTQGQDGCPLCRAETAPLGESDGSVAPLGIFEHHRQLVHPVEVACRCRHRRLKCFRSLFRGRSARKHARSERLRADSVEKHPFAIAETLRTRDARNPLLSGFSRLLRCGKDLCQFPKVLGGRGEEKFIVCATWAA